MPVNKKGELLPEISWPQKSVNTLESDDRFGLADLSRLEEQHAHEPAVFKQMRLRHERATSAIEAINSLDPESAQNPIFRKELLRAQRTQMNLEPRMALYKESARERFNIQATNIVSRDFSERAVNSYVAQNSNNLEAQTEASRMAWQGYGSLAQQRSNIMNTMQGLRQESITAARDYMHDYGPNPSAAASVVGNAGQMKELAQQLIPITLAMQQLKQQGLDPQSRQRALIATGDKAAGLLDYNRLEAEMKSGTGLGAFNPAELKRKEAEAAEKLIKALEELRNSAGKTKEELDELNNNAEIAAKEFEEISEARGMPGGGDKYASEKIIAGTVAEALSIITSAYQNVAINQPMQMVQNVAGAANLENEKYGMWHHALSGDMTARMTLGAWEKGNAFGNQLAGNLDYVHGSKMVTNTVGAVLGAVQIGEAGFGAAGSALGLSRVEAGAQGAKSLISGLAGDVVEGAAWYRQTEKARLRIDSTHAVVNAAKALNHITGQQLQQYRTYTMGLNEAAGEMGGSAGEAFLNEAGSAQFLERMQASGVGVKEMGMLSANAAATMGSMFNKEQIFQAVELERLGFGNADQNMKRMGTLGAAGISDPGQNLGKIIEEAMQRGLNSSKAIDMIIENTARMSEETVRAGGTADPTEFITKSILSAIDKNNPNKELASQIAYQTYQSEEGARHNIATSFPGIINVDRNMKDLGLGTDRLSAALLTQIPTGMLNAYKGKSEDELKEFLEGRGIQTKSMDPNLFKGGKIIDILNKNASISELAQQSGVGYAIGSPGALMEEILKNQGNKEVTNALIYGKNLNVLSDEQRSMRAGVAAGYAIQGKNAAAGIANAAVLAGVETDKDMSKTLADLAFESTNTARGAATFEKRLGNMADAQQAAQGGRVLGADTSGNAGIKALAETGRIAFEKAAEKAWGEAAAKTAASFGESAMLLNNASGKLDEAADKLIKGTAAMSDFSNTVRQLINDIKQKTDGKIDDMKKTSEKLLKKLGH